MENQDLVPTEPRALPRNEDVTIEGQFQWSGKGGSKILGS